MILVRLVVAVFGLAMVATSLRGEVEDSKSGPSLDPIPPIARVIPPPGKITLDPKMEASLRSRVSALKDRVWEIDFKSYAADAGVFVKAVEYALEHQEFYSEKDPQVAGEMLDLAEKRIGELNELENCPSWLSERGRVVRGFRSRIDDSYQPYGVFIPEALDLSKPVPLLVWLHGRGDKVTDLHFLQRCLTREQAFNGLLDDWEEAIILYPFGRQSVGWKHAGETDVFEAMAAASLDYPIDPDRIALAGFSMGGAGAWHIGAHYRDRFCAVHAGAGFAETKEYNRLNPDQYPPKIEQTLWQVYDVPHYVRNLLNGPLLAYSGSEDKQKQAADLMARSLREVGHQLKHLVGDGMGHRYDQDSADAIRRWLNTAWGTGRNTHPAVIEWQTPTLRYPGFAWLQLRGMEEHWETARAQGVWDEKSGQVSLELENVHAIEISRGTDLADTKIEIGNQVFEVTDPGFEVSAVSLKKRDGLWQWGEPESGRKRPGIQGPIDDAFMTRFVVVPPTEAPGSAELARWVEFELNHFRKRWRSLMRGQPIEKMAAQLNSEDLADAHLILWGDPGSNPMMKEVLDSLPIGWDDDSFTFQGQVYLSSEHVPVMIYPNPLNPERYVVINSGLTFREAHDRTNSLQNPKLPDWAILGLDQLPNATAAGRIESAGFFDEYWQLKP
ncbi:MAG: prolyl oligopeptidase family serine peptidase [Verrucomicrobiota bacterium]